MNQKYIIYGATGGVGSALVRELHESGFDLHLAARDETRLSELASETGSSYSVFEAEDESSFTRVASEAGESITGLAYCVGTINLRSINRLNQEDFLQDFRVNAIGAAIAVQSVLSTLKKSGGDASVVLFSSVAAARGFPMHASISMAKGAVSSLVLSLAAELAPKVRVNAIAPSLTRTPLSERLLPNEEAARKLAKAHPLNRLGEAGDVAALAAFLLSPQSGWMTGQILGLDGGRSTLEPI